MWPPLTSSNNSRAGAARNQAQAALDELAAQTPAARAAAQGAKDAAVAARDALDQLIQALPDESDLIPVLQEIRGLANETAESFSNFLSQLGDIALKVEKMAAVGAGAIVGAVVGLTVGQILEFFAGADIILPASGSNTNFTSRLVATHEYGHFALCNLLNNASSSKFALAYDEAASQGFITNQAPTATAAVINESFADLFASQVAGATNYAAPQTNVVLSGGNSYCLAANVMPANACIEDNATNLTAIITTGFERNVRRYVGMFVDAFDGSSVMPPRDNPFNGNVWQGAAGSLSLASNPGLSVNDETVGLSTTIFRPYQSWISHALSRGTLLREDNVFGGLSDAMIEGGFNWCQRCEVFRLHTQDSSTMAFFCPEQWVGTRPTFTSGGATQTLACTFEGCPPGTTANAATRACEPPCGPNEHFDAFQLKCVPDIIIP